MSEPLLWSTAVALVLAAVASEINLLRSLLREAQDAPPRRPRREDAGARAWRSARIVAACVLGGAAAPGLATAQEPPADAAPEQAPASLEGDKSPYSLQFNVDFTNAYFYRGIIQEDTGLIVQPAARLTINLHESDEFKLDTILGVWNSVHGQKTAARTHGDLSEYWYEADLQGGFAVTKGEFTLTALYVILTSPSDAYETVQELDLTLAYDDTELLGAWALHPYVLLAVETGADASDGADSDTGTYLELGIAPGFPLETRSEPIAISFPVTLGLSLKDYYQDAAGDDETFGFVQAGVKASIPLPVAGRWGAWSLNAGVYGLFLGDHTENYNGGDGAELIGTVGLQVNF